MPKMIVIVGLTVLLSACGTVGGTLSGAGQDLQRVGDWIKPARK